MKMKKIIVTGMAFLTAMTVFAGCGSAGKEETNIAEEASTAGENENQEVSISSGESLTIPVSDLTESAAFYPVNVDGTEMEVIAMKTSDGTIRTAFNTCQVCYDSGNGYYKQEGDKLVCQYRPYDDHQIRKHCLDFFVHKGLLFVSKIVCQ